MSKTVILYWSWRFPRAEDGSRVSQSALNLRCGRVRAAEHTPCDPVRVLERRHGLGASRCADRGGIRELLRAAHGELCSRSSAGLARFHRWESFAGPATVIRHARKRIARRCSRARSSTARGRRSLGSWTPCGRRTKACGISKYTGRRRMRTTGGGGTGVRPE